MKRILTLLAALMLSVAGASAISYDYAARQAYYLTDKMAYELNLTDSQYDRVYQINLDYFLKCSVEADINGYLWEYRNACLARVLFTAQWRIYNGLDFLLRPLRWRHNRWFFPMYEHYGRNHFYRPAPPPSYRGPRPGDMRPGGPRPGGPNHDMRPGGPRPDNNRNGYRGGSRPGGQPSGVGGNDRPGGQPSGVGGNDRPGGQPSGVGGNGRPSGQPSGVGGNGRPSGQPSGVGGSSRPSGQSSSVSGSRNAGSRTPVMTNRSSSLHSGATRSSSVSSSRSSSSSVSSTRSGSTGGSRMSSGGGSRGGSRAGSRR